MEILKYIRDGFSYTPMIDRIYTLEARINMLESQLIAVDCRTRPTCDREQKLDFGLNQLSEILKGLGVDSGTVDNMKFQLKEAVKWNY